MKFETKDYEVKMKKAIDAYRYALSSLRAGKASAEVLNKVAVDYYGTMTPISQMAEIKTADARTLIIQPWDTTTVKSIEKAILASDIGITPMNDGRVLRLVFPPLTEDRRKEMCKQISKMGEEAKVAVRNIRRDANDKIKDMKKKSEMSEDEAKAGDKSVQDLTDRYITEIDNVTTIKEKDIMEI